MKVEKKRRAPKMFFDGRKEFIRHMQKTGVMDIKQLRVTNSSYIEGTTVNGESFTGLNFCSFCGLLEDRESFSTNLLLKTSALALYR